MTATDIISGGVLLCAIGAIGLAISRPEPTAEETPETNKTPDTKPTHEPLLQSLRASNKVRLVEGREIGFGVAHLPNGVYGFTFAPHNEAPLFEKKMFQSFEVHKLAGGAVHIIGFVTEEEAARLAVAAERVDVKLYPDPYEKSAKAVSVPVDRIERSAEPSRDNGNFLKLSISPPTL